jgi:hypothetical protein
MSDYTPQPLLFFTRTEAGIVANILVDSTLTRMAITPSHALAMLASLADLIARDLE